MGLADDRCRALTVLCACGTHCAEARCAPVHSDALLGKDKRSSVAAQEWVAWPLATRKYILYVGLHRDVTHTGKSHLHTGVTHTHTHVMS